MGPSIVPQNKVSLGQGVVHSAAFTSFVVGPTNIGLVNNCGILVDHKKLTAKPAEAELLCVKH